MTKSNDSLLYNDFQPVNLSIKKQEFVPGPYHVGYTLCHKLHLTNNYSVVGYGDNLALKQARKVYSTLIMKPFIKLNFESARPKLLTGTIKDRGICFSHGT